MPDHHDLISDAFIVFSTQVPNHAKAWMTLGRQEGIPFHVTQATEHEASRQDALSAILVRLPAAGYVVTQTLTAAQRSLDTATQGA